MGIPDVRCRTVAASWSHDAAVAFWPLHGVLRPCDATPSYLISLPLPLPPGPSGGLRPPVRWPGQRTPQAGLPQQRQRARARLGAGLPAAGAGGAAHRPAAAAAPLGHQEQGEGAECLYGGSVAVRQAGFHHLRGVARGWSKPVVFLLACYGLAGQGSAPASCLCVLQPRQEPHLNPYCPGCVCAVGGATAAVLKASACLAVIERCVGGRTALCYTMQMGVRHLLQSAFTRRDGVLRRARGSWQPA